MVIFGAGASYDSAPRGGNDYEVPLSVPMPPLTKDLVADRFGEFAVRFPASRPIIDRLREVMTGQQTPSLEAELAKFQDVAQTSRERRRQLLAFRFYLSESVSDATNRWWHAARGFTYYLRLLDRLADWQRKSNEPIVIVTFNYDLMVDSTLADVVTGWNLNGLPSYIDRPDWKLLKLHGSVGWSRVALETPNVIDSQTPARTIARADELSMSGTFIFRPVPDVDSSSQTLVPAIAVPMAGKTSFECPDDHLQAFRVAVERVERLLICGWRGAEPHAVEILDGVRPGYRLGIVTGSAEDLQDVQTNLGSVARKGKPMLEQTGGMTALMRGLDGQLAPLLAEDTYGRDLGH